MQLLNLLMPFLRIFFWMVNFELLKYSKWRIIQLLLLLLLKIKDKSANGITRKNIELLRPKIIFWAHHLAPKNLPDDDSSEILRKFFVQYFKDNASTSKRYEGESSFMELCYVLENAIILIIYYMRKNVRRKKIQRMSVRASN